MVILLLCCVAESNINTEQLLTQKKKQTLFYRVFKPGLITWGLAKQRPTTPKTKTKNKTTIFPKFLVSFSFFLIIFLSSASLLSFISLFSFSSFLYFFLFLFLLLHQSRRSRTGKRNKDINKERNTKIRRIIVRLLRRSDTTRRN